jgi:hypothetical protein
MRVKFQADGDLDGRVIHSLRRAEPGIDIRTATHAGLDGLPDSEVRSSAFGLSATSPDQLTRDGTEHGCGS